ncbi:methylenetetrahydrofolate dehydrogenase (NADP+) / methenyltetrahydrofolate cyclohydrolase [Hathewaya proteolytica DSM 3090]|uniref:Bifunctional protein FolD n=1 Tax=Hathewaya proteolytica DSM 3090 TaxID=1121331 RepID=A0A1M6L4P4_9CLOT|nr:bifunctional 5,10-methylenetetrahydrofolate dehydrogenase/5,10-methenyltetrahydrofolate cyclohydrolase [Hathewaya proteolytica]SHJ66188.1 methylenetetrahydrofolate dehydrogenase (NADP+) / methenyltetrahydrofolate cyclohydrolase [Hathewaya proteolytica DSM 3090]
MGTVLKGKELKQKISEELKEIIISYKEKYRVEPCFASILIGNDGGSMFYVEFQKKNCESLGIKYELIHLSEGVSTEEVIDIIEKLNCDTSVHGIMMQVPLPSHLDEKAIIHHINPDKDVDSLTDTNAGRLFKGSRCFEPCTPKAVMELLDYIGEDLAGKRAVVIGRSNIVGKPLAIMLLKKNATVTVCHSHTKDIKSITKEADILVSCVGKPHFVNSEFVKPGAIVMDVGTSDVNGKITGDVDFDDVEPVAGYITPVPGGVGSITTMLLLKNTLKAMERNLEIK